MLILNDQSLTGVIANAVWSSAMSIFLDRVTLAIMEFVTIKLSLMITNKDWIWAQDLGDLRVINGERCLVQERSRDDDVDVDK